MQTFYLVDKAYMIASYYLVNNKAQDTVKLIFNHFTCKSLAWFDSVECNVHNHTYTTKYTYRVKYR